MLSHTLSRIWPCGTSFRRDGLLKSAVVHGVYGGLSLLGEQPVVEQLRCIRVCGVGGDSDHARPASRNVRQQPALEEPLVRNEVGPGQACVNHVIHAS